MSDRLLTVHGGVPDGVTNVRDFGADGYDTQDDSAAIQAALDSLVKPVNQYGWSWSGGIVYFPPGRYRVTETLDIRAPNVTIQGSGGPSKFGRSCWIEFRGKGPLFRFPDDTKQQQGFCCRDLLLVATNNQTTGFEIWTGDTFRRDFLWDRVGMYYFGKAIHVQRKDGQTQVGNMRIRNCRIQHNDQAIVFGPSTSCNHFIFRENDAGNNRVRPVFDLRVMNAAIVDNIVEGQPDTILIRESEDARITGNFFEANKGPCITIIDSRRIVARPNRYVGDLAEVKETP